MLATVKSNKLSTNIIGYIHITDCVKGVLERSARVDVYSDILRQG